MKIHVCGLLVSLASVSLAGIEYEVIQIGNLAGYESGGAANAINSHGQVVGYSAAPGTVRGWQWSQQGGMVAFSDNGGTVSRSVGNDINDLGIVTGDATINGLRQAFRWQNGSAMAAAGTMRGEAAFGTAINFDGTIVGTDFENSIAAAVKWPAAMAASFLPNYGFEERSSAMGINDAGTIVGAASAGGTSRATIFRTNNTLLDLHGLLGVGIDLSHARDINEAGWVAGFAISDQMDETGFIYNQDLGIRMINPAAGFDDLRFHALNDSGTAVGFLWNNSGIASARAAIWQDGQTATDLNTLIDPNSGWVLQQANDINVNGWIVGTGEFNGIRTNFLAKPVPEPGTMVLAGAGVLALIRRRRRTA